MAFVYQSGETVQKGDRITYHGELGNVDFLADPLSPTPETDWYVEEFGGGVMIIVPDHMGSVFIHDPATEEDLEFVGRV